MADVIQVIDYEGIIKSIGNELQVVFDSLVYDEDVSKIKGIEISDEQIFVKRKENKQLRDGTVYIVVRFGTGTTNFGVSVVPVSLVCVGTSNTVKPTQKLLSAFSSTWTTKVVISVDDEGTVIETDDIQTWNSPEIISNFNSFEENFRNLYKLTGYIVLGARAARLGVLKYVYDESEEPEEVSIMAFNDSYTASLNPQPFGNTYGFAKSEVNFSTYSFSVSTYLLNGHFTKDLMKMRGFKNNDDVTLVSNNKDMIITIEFTNGYSNIGFDNFFSTFKVASSSISQRLGELATLTVGLSR